MNNPMKTIGLVGVLTIGIANTMLLADDDLSQNEIRRLVQQGEIIALDELLKTYSADRYGKLLDLEVEREHGTIVYEFEFLQQNGQVIELEIDATNGRVIKQEIED